MMTLPKFIIVGAAKSGTTSLYMYLRSHPSVYMPHHKEPNFFAGISSGGSITSFDDYQRLFLDSGGRLSGEASVTYLPYYERAIPKIRETLGDVKIIMILRNPVARCFSHFSYYKQLGIESAEFPDVLSAGFRNTRDPWGGEINCYLNPGYYYEQVRAYIESFSSVKIFLYEDLSRQEKIKRDLCDFLSLDYYAELQLEVRNISGEGKFRWVNSLLSNRTLMHKVVRHLPMKIKDPLRYALLRKREIDDESAERLYEIYAEDVIKLQSLIGRDLREWLAR